LTENNYTEEDKLRILQLADKAVKDLEREINKLPTPFVWHCKSLDEVKRLKQHYERGINRWKRLLPGSDEKHREGLLEFIQEGQRQLKDIYMVLESLQ
jgi:hypothetical protein